MGGRGDWTKKKNQELYGLSLFILKAYFHQSSSRSSVGREPYLDFPNGCLGVNGDGGVPTSPPRGRPTQGSQRGCRQAGQAPGPLEGAKDQNDLRQTEVTVPFLEFSFQVGKSSVGLRGGSPLWGPVDDAWEFVWINLKLHSWARCKFLCSAELHTHTGSDSWGSP